MQEKIINILRHTNIGLDSLKKELNIVTKSQEYDLMQELNILLESGEVGFLNNRYVLLSKSDISLAKVINKKRNNVTIKLIPSNDEVDISGDSSKMLLINDLIYVKKILGSYHAIDYYKNVDTLKGRFSLTKDGIGKVIVDYLDRCGISVVLKKKSELDLHEGDLVLTKIVDYQDNVFIVEIVSLLVKSSDLGSDIEMIVESFDAPITFSNETLLDAKKINQELSKEDYIDRVDLRDELIYTIDGKDSRDYDDAVSVKRNGIGYEIGVHIADVTNYVKPNHNLDNEAIERGTSIYLADRVIPMLPFELSNGICSLNPNVDRLALSVIMNVDGKGNIYSSKIFNSVINSKARLNYDEVNDLLNNKETNINKKVQESLKLLFEASSLIRKKREKAGAINLETTEIKFILDEKNNPINVKKLTSGLSENMIEDLMVSANVEVAKALKKKNIPILYRIHEYPTRDKYELFKDLIKRMDYTLFLKLPKFENITSSKLNDFINDIKDVNLKYVYSYLLLRAMSKARYAIDEVGHFGLNELQYCHFTSPIRRYPDIIIHRLVKDYLINNREVNIKILNNYLERMGKITSDLEVRADQIERMVNDLEACKYMNNHIGKTFNAKITGFIKKGMFLETDIGIEGFLPFYLSGFENIKYEMVKDTLIGIKVDDNVYSFGTKLDIVPIYADFNKYEITFTTKSFYDKNVFSLDEKERYQLVLNGIQVSSMFQNETKYKKDFEIRDYKKRNSNFNHKNKDFSKQRSKSSFKGEHKKHNDIRFKDNKKRSFSNNRKRNSKTNNRKGYR